MPRPFGVRTSVYSTGHGTGWAHTIDINGKRLSHDTHPEYALATKALKEDLQQLQRDIAKALLSL